jgi:DNA-binding PadR family transcriptional regulator
MKGRKLTQHILFRADNIDRACYMLTEAQWKELEEVAKILGNIDNDIQSRA